MSRIPTVEELLALPYGKTTRSDTPSVDELLELPYVDQSSAAQGFIGEHNRREMRNYGQRVAWYQAIESNDTSASRQGKVFVEKYLDPAIRVFLNANKQGIQNSDAGQMREGESQMAYMPDEITPRSNDRFVGLEQAPQGQRQTIQPSNAVEAVLLFQKVVSIDGVYNKSGAALRPSSYSLQGNRVRWAGVPPVEPVTVLYLALPEYEWLGEGMRHGPLGQDGVHLPSFGNIRLLTGKRPNYG